jgi:NhaP-type Na+/H+ or K+/H+ antiporter
MLKDYVGARAKSILNLLQIEAILSTGLVVIIPFIIIDIIRNVWLLQTSASSSPWNLLMLLVFQLIVGIGSGVAVGLIVLRSLQKIYSHHFSSVSLLAGVLIAYLLAENLGGNGALAVAALGFLFGRFYVRDKPKLQEFSCMLSNSLEILVFIALGLIIKIPFTLTFIIGSLLIFFIILLSRMGAVFTVLRKDYSLREKLFVGLNMPKGVATAVILFALALYNYGPFDLLLQLILAFMIYSLILSTIVDKLSWSFVKDKKIPVKRIRPKDMISLDKSVSSKGKARKKRRKK